MSTSQVNNITPERNPPQRSRLIVGLGLEEFDYDVAHLT